MYYKLKQNNGQSLIELLTGVAIVSIFLLAAVLIIVSVLRINRSNLDAQTAQDLAIDILDKARSVSTGNWQGIYGLSLKGPSNKYYVTSTASGLQVASGTETISIDDITFSRYFFVENVCRNNTGGTGGVGDILEISSTTTCAYGTEDPSSQKITAKVTWTSSADRESEDSKTFAEIVTRFTNKVIEQNSWTGGPVGNATTAVATTTFSSSTNIYYSSSTGAIRLQNQ